MKKLYILIQLIALLICAPAAYAESSAEARLLSLLGHLSSDRVYKQQLLEAATDYANEALRPLNDNMDYYPKEAEGRALNADTYLVYRLLAYGEPHGTFNLGHYRYFGYTPMGEDYTNPLFRPDFTGYIDIDSANWIEAPEKKDEVKQFVKDVMKEERELAPNNFDRQRSTHKYRYNIAGGLLLMHEILPGYYKVNKNTVYDRDWENYVHILQPPTKYTFGVGRMFRKLPDGSMRYMSVPLASGELVQLDLSATLKEEAYQGEVSSVIESTATFALYKDAVRPVAANLRLYMKTGGGETEIPFTPNPSKVVSGNQYTFQPGEKLEVKFNFTVPDGPAEIVARIDQADNTSPWTELNMDNNEDRAPVIFGQYDVKVKITLDDEEHIAFDGEDAGVSYTVRVTRKDGIPGDIPVTLTVSDPSGREVENFNISAGGSEIIPFDFTAGAGSYTIEAQVWPDDKTDIYPPDNTDKITVTVRSKSLNIDSKIRVELIDN